MVDPSYDVTQIVDEGGNMIALVELDGTTYQPAGTLTKGTNCINLGHIAESETGSEVKIEEVKNEAKVTVKTTYEYAGKTTGTLMQRGKAIIDWMEQTVKGHIYLEIKYNGLVGGKHQEQFAIVEVPPQAMIKTPGGYNSMKYESRHLAPATAIAYDTSDMSAIETALGITIHATAATIPANAYRVIVETTPA